MGLYEARQEQLGRSCELTNLWEGRQAYSVGRHWIYGQGLRDFTEHLRYLVEISKRSLKSKDHTLEKDHEHNSHRSAVTTNKTKLSRIK